MYRIRGLISLRLISDK